MLVAACGLPKHLLTLWVGGQRLSYEECFSKDCLRDLDKFIQNNSSLQQQNPTVRRD